MNFKLIFSTILFLSFQANASSGFCFSSDTSLGNVQKYLKTVLLPSEKVVVKKSVNCLEIEHESYRKELIENFLIRRYVPTDRYVLAAENIVKRNCRIEVLRKGKSRSESQTYKVGNDTVIRKGQSDSQNLSRSELLLGAGRSGKIEVDEEKVEIRCLPKAGDNIDIEVSVYSSFKKSMLVTSLSVKKGESIDIGSVVEELKEKDKNLSSKSGIEVEKKKGKSEFQYTLIVH